MGAVIDLTNRKFNMLTVLSRYGTAKDGQATWLCRCDCGNEKIVESSDLKNGKTKSCGCLKYKHRESKTKLFWVWDSMIKRCERTTNYNYANYGGRGISVCAEWHDFIKFKEWAVKVGYNPNATRGECTLDRIDVNGNYCPENCRWVNAMTQSNNRRCNHYETINGETHTISEWARLYNINRSTLQYRLNNGNQLLEALTPSDSIYKNIRYNNEVHSIVEWAQILKMNTATLRARIKSGWTVEDALTTPIGHKRGEIVDQP